MTSGRGYDDAQEVEWLTRSLLNLAQMYKLAGEGVKLPELKVNPEEMFKAIADRLSYVTSIL